MYYEKEMYYENEMYYINKMYCENAMHNGNEGMILWNKEKNKSKKGNRK